MRFEEGSVLGQGTAIPKSGGTKGHTVLSPKPQLALFYHVWAYEIKC